MQSISFISALIGVLLGLTLGFCISNGLYKAELQDVSLRGVSLNSQAFETEINDDQAGVNTEKLSNQELQQAVSQADNNPNNTELQKTLGLALYKYAALEQKTELLPDVIRLLKRVANKNTSNDAEVFATLGNALFVLAKEQNHPGGITEAQTILLRAVQIDSKNSDLHVALGLTYYFAQPSNPQAAIKAYQQALQFNPNNQKALENLITALLAVKRNEEAQNILRELERVDPQSSALSDLKIRVAQAALKD